MDADTDVYDLGNVDNLSLPGDHLPKAELELPLPVVKTAVVSRRIDYEAPPEVHDDPDHAYFRESWVSAESPTIPLYDGSPIQNALDAQNFDLFRLEYQLWSGTMDLDQSVFWNVGARYHGPTFLQQILQTLGHIAQTQLIGNDILGPRRNDQQRGLRVSQPIGHLSHRPVAAHNRHQIGLVLSSKSQLMSVPSVLAGPNGYFIPHVGQISLETPTYRPTPS